MTRDKLPAPPNQRPEIVDPNNAPVIFADWIVTGGTFNGVVNLTLGTIDHSLKRSNDELARVMVATRLRFSIPFARALQHALAKILTPPCEPSQSPSDDPEGLPENLIN